ncbi:DNA polymerase epsilon subunit D [Beauveria bassiana]|nr:DNA polymerase epsilon subunit D [Beauveria bassiana]KAH8720194.1 DNA polymerase epsilon subunit D [Beauveria bassiana]
MPTRKSDAHKGDVSALAAGADDTSQTNIVDDSILSTATTQADREKSITEGSTGNKKGKETAAVENDKITIEDLTLPKSIITRLAKGVLPANTQIQANAIMAMSKSTTVFISYLAAHANEITLNANKKTIMPADVFKALEEIEFDFLKEPLEAEFAKFNAIQTDKRNTYRQKVKAATKPTGANEDEDDTDMAGGDTSTAAAAAAAAATAATTASKAAASNGDGDKAPRSKKARVDASPAPEETTDADEDAVEETDEDEKEEEEEDEEEEEEEDEEDEGGEGRDSSEETQDALEERPQREEPDEALDGDESD